MGKMFDVTVGGQYITFFLMGQCFGECCFNLSVRIYKTRIVTWMFESSASV